MKKIKIYLAGKMGGLTLAAMNKWRIDAKHLLVAEADKSDCVVEVVNPVVFYNFEEKRHQTEIEVEEFDLGHVISSDIIVVNLNGLNSSIGTIIELHDAHYHKRIPVIAFGDKTLYSTLHPWVKNDITRVEDDIYGVVEYIRDFYMK